MTIYVFSKHSPVANDEIPPDTKKKRNLSTKTPFQEASSKILASSPLVSSRLNPAFHLFAHRCIQGAKYESIATVLLSLHLFSSPLFGEQK